MTILSTFIEPLGWALLHFLWQGALIALLLRGFLVLTRRRSPQVRYAASGVAMLLMLGAATGTVFWQAREVRDGTERSIGKSLSEAPVALPLPHSSPDSRIPQPQATARAVPLPAQIQPLPAAVPAPLAPATVAAEGVTAVDRMRPLLPWLVGLWAAGVFFFSLRLLNGWRLVHRWRGTADTIVPDEWAERFHAICQRLGICRAVQLLSSASLAVPVVIGWLKPVVLVPAGLFTGLSTGQLEALLAHELAHVRRHDYLVNLLQSALETLFFYHPAVWWVSGQLRKEREHCCDDVATALAGGVLDYARALAALEELRAVPALGVSAAGSSLLQRIRRLAGVSEQRASGLAWPLGLLTIIAVAAAIPFTLLRAVESDFAAPQSAHVSTEKHSAYCVHDGKETHFILISGTPFSSSTSSGANPKLRTWHDDGAITFDGGGEVTFSRKSANAGTLNLTYSSGKEGALSTTAYELSKGRVLFVAPDVAPRQFDKQSPPVTAQEALEKLYFEIAADLQTREGAAPVVRGLSLAGIASTTDAEHIADLYEPVPGNPDKFRKKSRVFEMEISGEKDEPLLKYPANSGAFYIQFKDRTWGPIPGNPMEKLRLTELLKDRLFVSPVLKVTVWLQQMILLHDDALLSCVSSLVQELKWYDHDIVATLIEAELKTRPASGAAGPARAALAHIKSLTDASKAKWEQLREKVPDEKYAKGRPVEAKDESSIWGDPNDTGLRLGLSGITAGAQCQTGMNQDVKFLVRNDGKAAVPFSWNWGMNKGFRASLTDAAGEKNLMLLHPGGGLVGLRRCRLEPGHLIELKTVQLMFSALGANQYAMSTFVEKPGHYTLDIEVLFGTESSELLKVPDVMKPGPEHVPGIGDWTGTLPGKPIPIVVPDANILTAKPGDTFEPSTFSRILFRKGLLNWNYREVLPNQVISLWIEGGDWKTSGTDGDYRAAWEKDGDRIWYVDDKGIQCLKLGRDWGDLGHWMIHEADGNLAGMPDGIRDILKLPARKKEGAGKAESSSLWDAEGEPLEPKRNPGVPRISGVFDVPRPVVALSWPGAVSLPDLSGPVAVPGAGSFADGPVIEIIPPGGPLRPSKHEETNDLLKLWSKEYHGQEKLPAQAMHRLAAKVKEYIERYPGEPAVKLKRQLLELEFNQPWDWHSAQAMLDAICDCATAPVGWLELDEQFRSFDRVKPGPKWSEEQLAKLPFGETHESGLRAAWIFNPMQDAYSVGSVLKCRILIHNNGKQTIEFRTDQWHQDDQWIAKNAAGEEVKVKTTRYTGLTPWQKVRLEPGQVYEVAAHGVGIGDGKYEESYSIGAIGAEIPARPGDELTCQWIVKLDPSWRNDPNWTQLPDSPPPSLTTGTVKFKVTAADPDAAPKVGIARGTGKYDLAEGIKLQVTQTTSSKDGEPTQRLNTATIEWYAGNGQLGISWPIELMPGLKIDTIIWMRGDTALWIVHEEAVRKIDFTNASNVKESVFKPEDKGDFGEAPEEVRKVLEGLVKNTGVFNGVHYETGTPTFGPSAPEPTSLVDNASSTGSITRTYPVPLFSGSGETTFFGEDEKALNATKRLVKTTATSADLLPPAQVLQFRLVAGREEPDTEPVEPVENWSDLPTFHLRKTAILTAADVKSATAELDEKTGRWNINLVFSEEGGAALAKVTKENLGRQLAIVGNGKVISAPVIQGEIGKHVMVSGNYLESEAKALVEAIQAAAAAGSGAVGAAAEPAAGLRSVISTAHSTGLFDLGSGVKLQITQVATPAGGGTVQRTNTATIQWLDAGGKPGRNWPIELSSGPVIDTIIWRRGTAALWIVQGKGVRKIDFSDAADVKEQSWTPRESGDFGGAPGDVLKLVREFAGSSRKFVDEIQVPFPSGNGNGSGGIEEGWKIVSLQGRDYVTADDIQKFYAFSGSDREGQAVVLRSPAYTLKLEPGTADAVIGNARYALSYPVMEKDRQLLVSRVDLVTLIDPALQPLAGLGQLFFDTVVIDPGHGGADNGSVSSIGTEKTYNLDIALRLKASLEKQGLRVALTRAADIFVQRLARVDIANSNPDAVFISIHANSGSVSSSGLETYALCPAHGGNQNNSANAVLAARVHQSVLQKLHQKDGGIRRHRFEVLAGVQIPALLIEAGYLTNPAEAALMNTPEYRQDLAQAIADGLLQLRSDAKQHAGKKAALLPAADPAAKDPGKANGELIISVLPDGSPSFSGQTLTLEALKAKLSEIAQTDKNRLIIIRGDKKTEYTKIAGVLTAVHEAGLDRVNFATAAEAPAPANQPVPNAPEPPSDKSPAPVPNGAVRVELLPNGSYLFAGAACDEEAFTTKLAAIAKKNPNRAIILEAGADVEFKWVQRVLEMVNESGLKQIGLSTERKGKEPASKTELNRAEARRLLETNRLQQEKLPDEARKALTQIVALLGKSGDDGFQPEDSLLLAEAQFELGRLDAREAGIKTPEDAGARRAFTELLDSAVKKHTEGLTLLIGYEKEHPKSVTARSQLALGYMELGQFFARKGDARDASVALTESVKLYTELVKERPDDAGYNSGLALAYNEAAVLIHSQKTGRDGAREALAYQNHSVESMRALHAKHPEDSDTGLRLAAFMLHNGELHGEAGDVVAARKRFAEVLMITAALLDGNLLNDAERKVVQSLSDRAKAMVAPDDNQGETRDSPARPEKEAPPNGTNPPKNSEGTIEHKDGTRTVVTISKDKSEVTESTFNKDGTLAERRVFLTDSRGRPRRCVIYDGENKPLELIEFGYDSKTDQLVEERQFNKKGKLLRRLFYPGTLKDEKYAGRFVAFDYNPDKPSEKPREAIDDVKPSRFLLTAIDEPVKPPKPANIQPADPFAVPSDPEKFAEARRKGILLNVLDASGQRPISEFRVVAGVRSQAGGEKDKHVVNWQPHTLKEGRNGGMIWPLDKAYDEMALRVEADGYAPQVFNWIEKKKGPQDLFFQMVESKETVCQVWTPDKRAAAGAVVALAMVQRDAVIEGGKLRHSDEAPPEKPTDRWRWPRILKTNEKGQVTLPPENDPTAALLVMHDSGVREISLAEFRKQNPGPDVNRDGLEPLDRVDQITLQPWARIEGKVLWSERPGADQKVSLTIHRDDYGYPGVIAQYETTVSGADGKFVFEKVLPGHVQISCPIAAEAGNKGGITEINLTGRIAHATVQPGNNTVVIGGSGRTVKGKLTGRDDWKNVTFHFHPTAPHIGFSGDDEMWKAWSEFQKSPAGPLFFRNGLKVNVDGTFEIPSVLPGHYQIFFSGEGEKSHIAGGKFSVEAEKPGEKPGGLTLPDMKATPAAADSAKESDKKKTSDASGDHPGVQKFEDDRHTAWVITAFGGTPCTLLYMGRATGTFGHAIFDGRNMRPRYGMKGAIKTLGGREFMVEANPFEPVSIQINGTRYLLGNAAPKARAQEFSTVPYYSPMENYVSPPAMRLLVLRQEGDPVQLDCEKLLQSADDLPEILKTAEAGLARNRTEITVPDVRALGTVIPDTSGPIVLLDDRPFQIQAPN